MKNQKRREEHVPVYVKAVKKVDPVEYGIEEEIEEDVYVATEISLPEKGVKRRKVRVAVSVDGRVTVKEVNAWVKGDEAWVRWEDIEP